MPDATWWYRDPDGNVQGPFAAAHMRSWYDNGYFPRHTYVVEDDSTSHARSHDFAPPSKSFRPIAAWWEQPKSQAFATPPQHSGRMKRKFGEGRIEFNISEDEAGEVRHKKPKKMASTATSATAAIIGPPSRPMHFATAAIRKQVH